MASTCGTLGKLPPEVRDKIFITLFQRPRAVLYRSRSEDYTRPPKLLTCVVAILKTCRQVYGEGRRVLALSLQMVVSSFEETETEVGLPESFYPLSLKTSFYIEQVRTLTMADSDVDGLLIWGTFPKLQSLYLVSNYLEEEEKEYGMLHHEGKTTTGRKVYDWSFGSRDSEYVKKAITKFRAEPRFHGLRWELMDILDKVNVYRSLRVFVEIDCVHSYQSMIKLTFNIDTGEIVGRRVRAASFIGRFLIFRDNWIEFYDARRVGPWDNLDASEISTFVGVRAWMRYRYKDIARELDDAERQQEAASNDV